MSKIEWGAPIDGPTMRSFVARGIDRSTLVKQDGSNGWFYSKWIFFKIERNYRLPADHPYYIVKAHNEQHGTSFVPWFGGDHAPDDWDGGEVLFRSGRVLSGVGLDWRHHPEAQWLSWGQGGIIGYRAKPVVKNENGDPVPVYRCGTVTGDHGTADQAIDWLLDHADPFDDNSEFLKCWREGNLDEWPEYYEWLNKQ